MIDAADSALDYVVIIGAGELVFPAYRFARDDLGLGIIAVDRAPDAMGMQYAEIPVEVSTKDVEDVVSRIRQLAGRYSIRGVFTCGADVEVTVAAVAEALGLPGIPLSVARRCNDKVEMHKYLDQAGFTEKARYARVERGPDAVKAARESGFPCVIKPVDNCASRGVQRVESAEEVPAAFSLADGLNIAPGAGVLVEEALLGSKHTVEMIAWKGERHLLSIIDTHYISDRWPCETGLNTTLLSREEQDRLFDFAARVSECMGIDFGAHKVDVNLAPDGRIGLIELTARLSGGFHCQYASPLAYGSNDIRAALKLAVGLPLDRDDIRHRYQRGAAVRAVFPPPGRITAIRNVDQARALPGVEEIFIWKDVGDRAGPYHDSADRFAYVIAHGEDTPQAIERAELAVSTISIETESVAGS